jgi:hypothetical protein
MVKVLPGAPWDEYHILRLLECDGYDLVIANGFEYTLTSKEMTPLALQALKGEINEPH